jgi:hypothetical protein
MERLLPGTSAGPQTQHGPPTKGRGPTATPPLQLWTGSHRSEVPEHGSHESVADEKQPRDASS